MYQQCEIVASTHDFGLNLEPPPKINMESKSGGLENDFPLQLGDF